MRSGAYSEIPAAIKFIAQAVAEPDKNPGRDLRLARDLCSPVNGVGTLTCRALAPAAEAEAAEAAPDTYPSPGSPSRPGKSASPEAGAEVAAEAVAVEAEARPRRRNCR